ncbi:gamma-glutamylcyclotransferase b isoform X1 [Cheilinus undulatus]|uniref:gamma-glutamylcyclotransferase b isoform X1 n=1 Tax=Cheilinus undulatus TaxID=241271 RepID=UPI001BD322AD|nr:gamma-glutamylcyclotransferase b isoform X1 [Cheilinus undulatus]
METAPVRRRRSSKETPPDLSDAMKNLHLESESFIKSHDGREQRMRQIVDELKTISDEVKEEQMIVYMLRASSYAVIGGIVLMVTAAVAGLTGGAGGALLALIVGVLLAVIAAGAGLLTAFTETVPTGRAALGTALAGAAAAGALLGGAVKGTILLLITAVLLAVVAAGAGVATAAGAAREEARKVILALGAAAGGDVGDDAFMILCGASVVVAAVAVVVAVATAAGAVLALIVGADLAVGAVSGLAGTVGAIIAIVGVTALITDTVITTFIEKGGADRVEGLVKELMQNVEPLKKNLEEMEKMLQKIQTDSGQESQQKEVIMAPLRSAVALIQTIRDMLTILNTIRVTPSPDAEEELRKSIIKSAEQSKEVTDSFTKMKLGLKQRASETTPEQ